MRLTLAAIKPNGWWFTLITGAHACGGLRAMRSTHPSCNHMAYGAAINASATATIEILLDREHLWTLSS
jgi:hypothetical protein